MLVGRTAERSMPVPYIGIIRLPPKPVHTSSTRLSTSTMGDSLPPGAPRRQKESPSITTEDGPHEFNSTFDKQYVGQFGSRPCRVGQGDEWYSLC